MIHTYVYTEKEHNGAKQRLALLQLRKHTGRAARACKELIKQTCCFEAVEVSIALTCLRICLVQF